MTIIHIIILLLLKLIYFENCILAFKTPINNNLYKFNIHIGHIHIPERSGDDIKWKHPRDIKRLHRYNLKAKGVKYMIPNFYKLYLRKQPSQIELLESIFSLL